MEEITRDYPEDIWNVVVMLKSVSPNFCTNFLNVASQKSFRALECGFHNGLAEGKGGSLFQDHMCPEEGTPFLLITNALNGHKARIEPECRQRKGSGKKRASDPPRMG